MLALMELMPASMPINLKFYIIFELINAIVNKPRILNPLLTALTPIFVRILVLAPLILPLLPAVMVILVSIAR